LVAFDDANLDTVPNAVAAYAQEKGLFEFAEADHIVHALATPNDPNLGFLWGLLNAGQLIQGVDGTPGADIKTTNAWNFTTGSSNIIVGMIDSGIDYNHPDLTNNMWRNPGEIPGNGVDDDGNGFVDDVFGYNFVTHTGNPYDDFYHGTATAGVVGAVGSNGVASWACVGGCG